MSSREQALSLAIAVGLLLACSGCAASVSAAAAPNVDFQGRLGTEERLQLTAGVGSPDLRFFAALGLGGGYLGGAKSGFLSVSPETGVEGGDKVQWAGSVYYAPRFLLQGPTDVVHGGGLAGQALFQLRRHSTSDGAGYAIGPRVSLEAVNVEPSLPDSKGLTGLVTFSLVFRWTTLDTTRNSWTR